MKFLKLVSRLLLYVNTLRYLKNKQLYYNIVRRFMKSGPSDVANCGIRDQRFTIEQPVRCINKLNSKNFTFLNSSLDLKAALSFQCYEMPKLWRYNLHYFDYLLDDAAPESIKDELIEQWIDVSNNLHEDAWEPYTLSLRIVNWVKYFSVYKNNDVSEKWLASLAKQAAFLARNMEYHILANHYFKNIKAMFFAGSYFQCDGSRKWLKRSMLQLLVELKEQVLLDGGHYEKSPMYHCILIEDCLDIINIIEQNSLKMSDNELAFIKSQTRRALLWLEEMLMPDGDIPLFNDSAFGITPAPDELFAYAERIIGFQRDPITSQPGVKSLDQSGYYIINNSGRSKCIIDCGSISPDYQPGHTHCDILSYELAINGRRVIVDTGLFDYENSPERQYCRSTRAHNTLVIDNREQSEIWGVFRVARRARVTRAELSSNNNTQVFEGSYRPYWSDANGISHTRNIKLSEGCWTFTDYVNGRGVHKITSYLHLHPDVELSQIDGEYYFSYDNNKLAKFSFSENVNILSEDSYYYPEFGIKLKNKTIMLSVVCDLPVTLQYVIKEQ